MSNLSETLFEALAGVAMVAWVIMVWCLTIVTIELRSAQKADETGKFARFAHYTGLPPAVIFTKNILPEAETERRWLVWSILTFIGCLLLSFALMMLFGSKH